MSVGGFVGGLIVTIISLLAGLVLILLAVHGVSLIPLAVLFSFVWVYLSVWAGWKAGSES